MGTLLLGLVISIISCGVISLWGAGENDHLRIRYGPSFENFYKPPRTIISNLNNPVGLSFGTTGFSITESRAVGRFLFIAEGGVQVADPLNPVDTAIDIRARLLRVPVFASDLVAGSNRVDSGENVTGSPEVSVVVSQFVFGQHPDRKLLGNNTLSILGIVPVPGSDDIITLSSNSSQSDSDRRELTRRFSPTAAQLNGDFSVPIDWNSDFSLEAAATGNAKTSVFAATGTRFFYTNVRENRLMYYENGFTLDGERIYFDFGPEGDGLNDPGPQEIPVRYPDAGMGLDVDPVTGELFYAVHGERGEIGAARVLRLSPNDEDPSSDLNVRRTSRIEVVGATIEGQGTTSDHEFDLDGNLNGVSFTNIKSIRFGPDPRNPTADPVLYVVEFAGYQDTSFDDVHTSNLYFLDIDRETNAAEKILLAEGIMNPVEMLVDRETGAIYLSLLGSVETLSGRNLPPGAASGSVVRLEPISVNNPAMYFVDGKGVSSTLILLNPSVAEEATGTVSLRDADGNPWSITINGSPADGSFSFTIPPSGMRLFSTSGAGSLMIGSIQVISRHPVDETVIFNGFTAAAGMGAIQSLSKFRIPILSDTSRGVRTGIALSNPTPTRVDVTLRLRDQDGQVVDGAKVTVSLAGNGQIVQFTEEFFDGIGIDFSQFSGTVEVSSSVPINGMAIRVSPGKFATLRATPIP